ncbi:MAG: hypothetical protein OEZ09_08690 [Betaproteobacteria bacterium]|nr:hypothetical protein [Betaproteobacteria bacterium]MDH4324638.1 hypothetical protein [Betaproteobacteria bacterium]MDH5211413.1 hypothetical protein [Betaproteobacteria bacterium]MDH5578525.1 hypothetical protein [Betaproteobacteria bacterium]
MRIVYPLIVLIASLPAIPGAFAHDGDPDRGGTAARAQLGKVHFETSCTAVAKDFDTSVALLHSFWVKDAIEGFQHVLKSDPRCAIAYWGIAMALQQNPLTGQAPNADATRLALAGLEKAKAIDAGTQRERDYLAAIGLIYKDADKTEFRSRRLAYEKAMEALVQRYPEDTEAEIFYALSLQMTADLADKTFANQLRSTAILEKFFKLQPEHPGVAHYLIHGYDYSAIARRGVEAARRYSQIAPRHPHALHMPSHIFTHLGSWQDSIDANRRSYTAAQAESNGQEQAHAMDYLVHAHLQMGQDDEARQIVAQGQAIDTINPAVFIGPYALAAMPARYALERRAWKEAANLEPRPSRFPFTVAITHFARGLGFARTGDTASAQGEAARLAALRDALKEQKNTYWANQVEVQRLAVVGWTALANNAQQEALASMRAAADLEDSMQKHIVTPAPVVPARELLGEMLLEAGQPREALAAFESSAQREPNRLRGMYGAGQAAARAGERAKAKTYYAKLAELAVKADITRPELELAKAYVAQN